jgi:hypothetical protein
MLIAARVGAAMPAHIVARYERLCFFAVRKRNRVHAGGMLEERYTRFWLSTAIRFGSLESRQPLPILELKVKYTFCTAPVNKLCSDYYYVCGG